MAGDTANFADTYDSRNAGSGKTLTPSGIVNDGNGGKNYKYNFVPSSNGTIIGASAFLTDPTTKMIALTIGAFGVFASLPIFWTLPTAFLAGAAVAPGIAAINSIGNLSGYFGPFAIGWIKDATGSFAWGLATIAACAVMALVITLALGHDPHLERAPEAA